MRKVILGGGILMVGLTAGLAMPSGSASALVDTPWGPDRKTFTWADPAPYAVFNSITDNPSIGDERNFVRVRDVTNNVYVDDITLEDGKVYEIYIYYHNNADGHEVGRQAIGIADGVTMTSNFPSIVKPGEVFTANAQITALDTEPKTVWDGVYLRANESMKLTYVEGSALIYNGGALNGQSIGPSYLFGEGALLGYNKFSGMLPGCNEYAGRVVYQLKAEKGETPVPPPPPQPTPTPDPEPVPEPTPTPTPSEIPNTGPAEVIVATVIVLAILGGGFYWLTTRKHLQKTARAASRSRAKAPARRTTAARRSPVKRSAVKRANRKRAVKKVVRKRK